VLGWVGGGFGGFVVWWLVVGLVCGLGDALN
jgi:hypothetical protein